MSSSNSTTWSKDQRVYSMLELQETLRKSALKAMEMLTNSPILAIFTPVLQCVWMGHPHKSHEIKSLFNLFLLKWQCYAPNLLQVPVFFFSTSRGHCRRLALGCGETWPWEGDGSRNPLNFRDTRLSDQLSLLYVCMLCMYIYIYMCVCSI